jgi:molecular chaperone Hsp33
VSELHKFIFEGLPVRGMLVQLTGAWQEQLRRRAGNTQTGPYPEPVQNLLGQMAAAAVLMQSNIKFNGALVLQIFGDGPVKVAVVEVQPDLSFRGSASIVGGVAPNARLSTMVNEHNKGRCAITLDPQDKFPGQQPYQGVVPLFGDQRQKLENFSEVLEHYMLQSEQLDTKLILAANDTTAAGLLIQRMPVQGIGNLGARANEDDIGINEDYNRIAILAASLTSDELLNLDAHTILHRLFWEEKIMRYEPQQPRFACRCSRERVVRMIQSLGAEEAQSIITERDIIEVGCDFCGAQYRFDAVDAAEIFAAPQDHLAGPDTLQ